MAAAEAGASWRCGSIRNRYVATGGAVGYFPAGPFTLVLPDGEEVRTDLYKGQRLRWRGWGRWFEQHALEAGDGVRFVAVAPGRYRVSFHPSEA